MEAFEVELAGTRHRFFPGARVRDLIGRLAPEIQAAIAANRAAIADAWGQPLGHDGALRPEGRYQVVETGL